MKNKIVVGSLTFSIVMFLFVSLFRGSYANVLEDKIKIDLFNNENIEILKDDMKNFIDLVDGNIITNSSFNLSSTLNENYDFLTRFVISFVLDNEEYFDITYGEDTIYRDDYGREYTTNKYIDIDTFYDITYKIFGVEYYYIFDEGLVVSDKVLLVDMLIDDFNMDIDKITNIVSGNGYYDVYVKYVNYELEYVYRFNIVDNNRLVISNLSIEG